MVQHGGEIDSDGGGENYRACRSHSHRRATCTSMKRWSRALSRGSPRGLREAAGQSSAHLLLVLAAHGLGTALSAAGAFWRELGRLYFTRLCHVPELAAVTVISAPPDEELQALADEAPPMVGAEYLRVETLAGWWSELDAVALGAMRAEAGGAAVWLAAQNPLWQQVGRGHFIGRKTSAMRSGRLRFWRPIRTAYPSRPNRNTCRWAERSKSMRGRGTGRRC